MSDKETQKNEKQKAGIVVIGLLTILTIAEFLVSSKMGGSTTLLAVIALVKSGLILQYFMHMPRVLNYDQDGEGH